MSRKVAGTTSKVVLFSSLVMVLVSTTAFAGATAVWGPCTASTPQAFAATYIHGGVSGPPLNPCLVGPVVACPAADALCLSPPNGLPDAHGDLAYARAHANRRQAKIRTRTSGVARAGGGLTTSSTVPSTADSLDLEELAPLLNGQIRFTLAGQMFLDPSGANQKKVAEDLIVTVYPNAAARVAGTPVVARGEVHTTGSDDLSQATFSGFFSSGDFTVVHGPGNTLTVTPVGGLITKTVTGVPDTSTVVVDVKIEAASNSVPGASPVGLILLTILLATVGFYVLQMRRRTAAV